MAVGSYDSILRILHCRSLSAVASFTHTKQTLLKAFNVFRLNVCKSAAPQMNFGRTKRGVRDAAAQISGTKTSEDVTMSDQNLSEYFILLNEGIHF